MNRYYFGEDWDAPVTEGAEQVVTPIGEECWSCATLIIEGDQGTYMPSMSMPSIMTAVPVHRECSLRDVLGGAGHFQDHDYWCVGLSDPDGGLTPRASALWVWEWVQRNGGQPPPVPTRWGSR